MLLSPGNMEITGNSGKKNGRSRGKKKQKRRKKIKHIDLLDMNKRVNGQYSP